MSVDTFPEWDALVIAPADSTAALAHFKAMARSESGKADDPAPRLRAQNPTSARARRVLVQIDLSEPKGDHDHCLFKSNEDTDGRKYAGRRRPQDYQPDRAATATFIPRTLLDPDLVYSEKERPYRFHYVCATGPDSAYVVVVHKRETGEPRYSFVTAYPCTAESLASKRKKLKLSLRFR